MDEQTAVALIATYLYAEAKRQPRPSGPYSIEDAVKDARKIWRSSEAR